MGCVEPLPGSLSPSAAASAAVQALQGTKRADGVFLQDFLAGSRHCSVELSCGGNTLLCSGNLLAPERAASLLANQNSLASACIASRRAKLLREAHPRHLEDAQAIAASAGCTALVCLPLLDSSAAAGSGGVPPCLGALTVGFPSDADISGAALKAALLLARTLVIEQRQALRDMAALVTSLLLPLARGSGPAADGSEDGEGPSGGSELGGSDFGGSDLDDADCWTTSGEESEEEEEEEEQQQQGLRQRQPRGGSGRARHAASPTASAASAGSQCGQGRLLTYSDPAVERRFAAYHAAHMLGVDAAAYFICFLFFLMEAFLPCTPFRLEAKMGTRCLLGPLGLVPGTLLLSKPGRRWFAAHRDLALACTWLWTTGWMSLEVCNYLPYLDSAAFRHPLYLQSFGWLTVVGLAFQMRFRYQAVALVLAYSINTQLLPAVCVAHFPEQPAERCVLLGLLRVLLHGVLLPLACCYVFESHARRLFMHGRRRA